MSEQDYPETQRVHHALEDAFHLWNMSPDDARYAVLNEIQRLSRRVEDLETALRARAQEGE